MTKTNKISFIAVLPPIQSAINLDGNGDGARIRLEVSRQYIQQVIDLQGFAGQTFKVTIEPTGDYYEGS